jgi:DMSO/TMAO reductase YedYZ molybdopterin-dependent catalytic subunit
MPTTTHSRRTFLQSSSAISLMGLMGCKSDQPLGLDTATGTLVTSTGAPGCPDPFAGGEFLEEVPWDILPDEPFGALTGQGWDGRRAFDLSLLAQGVDNVDSDLFFVRTHYPDLLTTDERDWTIRIHGLVDAEVDVHIDDVYAQTIDQGQILIECSGNGAGRSFGLMSAARFAGAPLLPFIESQVGIDPSATMVKITGFDEHSVPSAGDHSTPGASWVFPLDDLRSFNGFLATQLNEEPLPLDNGYPVRLLVPTWYGCTCIKWVTDIELVDDSAPSSGQMIEFATRTHQTAEHAMAADFSAAHQQLSATPVRVEKWRLNGEIAYRVVGIVWGGQQRVTKLRIRHDDQDEAVTCFDHIDNRTWNLWVHKWVPSDSGTSTLSCYVDEDVPQVRLDEHFYDRAITIDKDAD